jgi:hypothetical protein
MVLKTVFGPKTDEIVGSLRKLRNEDLHYLYSSPNKIRKLQVKKNEMGMPCNKHGERINAYRVSAENPDGKKPLGRPRFR